LVDVRKWNVKVEDLKVKIDEKVKGWKDWENQLERIELKIFQTNGKLIGFDWLAYLCKMISG